MSTWSCLPVGMIWLLGRRKPYSPLSLSSIRYEYLILLTCLDDLALGEEEAILPAVPQFYQVWVLDPAYLWGWSGSWGGGSHTPHCPSVLSGMSTWSCLPVGMIWLLGRRKPYSPLSRSSIRYEYLIPATPFAQSAEPPENVSEKQSTLSPTYNEFG